MSSGEKEEVRHYNNKTLDEIAKLAASFDVLLLDESLCAVKLGLLNEDKLSGFLWHKPRGLEVILTGHAVSEKMQALADYVTEIRKVKHPYDKGVSSRQGIEY